MLKQSQASLQLTTAIIKPHVLRVPHVLQDIRDTILANNFYVIRTKRTMLTEKLAAELYSEHKNKFFYNRLITFMCSGAVDVHILAHVNAIQLWRELMGPTKSYQAGSHLLIRYEGNMVCQTHGMLFMAQIHQSQLQRRQQYFSPTSVLGSGMKMKRKILELVKCFLIKKTLFTDQHRTKNMTTVLNKILQHSK